MGNVNMEAKQVHVRNNSHKTWHTVDDALSALDASGASVAEDITDLYTRDASRASKDDIAGEFSAEQAYYTGDFVYYQGSLFKFIADHAAGAWNPEEVAPEQIGPYIVTLKSGLTNFESYTTTDTLVGKWNSVNLYRKLIQIQSLPNNDSITIQTGMTCQVVMLTGYAEQNGYTITIPYTAISGGIVNARLQSYGTELIISTTADFSAYSGYVLIYYTR